MNRTPKIATITTTEELDGFCKAASEFAPLTDAEIRAVALRRAEIMKANPPKSKRRRKF